MKKFYPSALLIAAIFAEQDVFGDAFTEYLAGRQIYAIAVDSERDLIWFGTLGGGLTSFDGARFTDYTTSNSDLRDNFIRSLAIDGDGNLWVGTNSQGAGRFSLKENTWVFYDTLNGLVNSTIRSIAIDGTGRIWFGTDGGIGMYDKKDWYRYTVTDYAQWDSDSLKWDTIKKYGETDKHLSNNLVYAAAADSSGNLWFGTDDGVSMLRGENEWQNFLSGRQVWSVLADRKERKWFGMDGIAGPSLYKLDEVDSSFVLQPVEIKCFSQNNIFFFTDVFAIIEDYDNNIWLGTIYGPFSFDPASMNWRCAVGSSDLQRKSIATMAADEDGNLWFGSQNPPGVTKYAANWTTFSTANGDSLESDEIFALARDQLGQVWIGTKRGVARFDSGVWHPKVYFPDNPEHVKNKITAIAVASDTTLWLGSFGGGVIHINPDASVIDTFTVANTDSGLVSDEVQAIAIDHEFIWFGTTQGVSRLHIQGTQTNWDTTFTFENTGGRLLHNQILALAVDLQSRLWIGTPIGLNRYDGAWTSFTAEKTPEALKNSQINSITVDRQSGQVWVGTEGGGASGFLNGQWERVTIESGLTDNFVKGVLVLNDRKEIWFATGGGVSCRDSTGQWTTYTTLDGLADNHVISLVEGENDDEIWFGTRADGVTRYRRQKERPDTEILDPIDITTQTEVDFRFIGNDLNTSKSLLRYSYKLDNERWSDHTFDTFARVKVLKQGLHTFYVKAIDRDGNEDLSPATKSFYKIAPDTGRSTSFTDDSGIHGLSWVQITLYWPPNLFAQDPKITIKPMPLDSLPSMSLFGYRLSAGDTSLKALKKSATLVFSFPLNDRIRGKGLGIYRVATTKTKALKLVGTTEINDNTMSISTTIKQLGLYAVRDTSGDVGALGKFDTLDFFVSAQPRIFSPRGGGHGEQTTISFKLDKSENVRIQVYNLAGRLVDTIWDQPMNAGVNAVAWDGKDRDERFCPSGLYIIVIQSNGFKSPPKPVKVMVMNE